MKITAEYRGTLAEPLSFLDKETGKKIERQRVVHNCEDADGNQFRVTDPAAQEIDLKTYKPPFKKGDKIEIELRLDPTQPLKARAITAVK